jgi:hypothetical protein
VTIASFKTAHVLAKKKKSYQDGKLIIGTLISGAESLFNGFLMDKRQSLL